MCESDDGSVFTRGACSKTIALIQAKAKKHSNWLTSVPDHCEVGGGSRRDMSFSTLSETQQRETRITLSARTRHTTPPRHQSVMWTPQDLNLDSRVGNSCRCDNVMSFLSRRSWRRTEWAQGL